MENPLKESSHWCQGDWDFYLPNLPLFVWGYPFRGGKLLFWVLVWDPYNKNHINKRKTNKRLLTHIPMGNTVDKQVTWRSGLEFKLKCHLNRQRRGGCIPLQFSSVTQLCPTLRPCESQHARPPGPSPTPGVQSDSHPLSQWCHLAISSSVVPFSSCPLGES